MRQVLNVRALLAIVAATSFLLPAPIAAAADPSPPLQFTLVFHYNQNLVPYARAADDILYRDLTRLFLRHPGLNFTLHVSGVLLESLQWMDPPFLRLLRDGVAEGNMEFLGSTYAQDLLYTTRRAPEDTGMDANQIRLHREILHEQLNVTPVGFWNAERVWSPELTDVIADQGYQYTFVEDHIQARAAIHGSEHLVRSTHTDRNHLAIFNDDKDFMHRFDAAIDNGNWDPVFQLLEKLHAEPGSGAYDVVYAQDAESSGLWDFEGGSDPQKNLDNLETFFRRVETTPWLRMVTPKQFLAHQEPSEDVTPIPKGAADWMGRDAWFQYQDKPSLLDYRARFGKAYDDIQAVNASLAASANPKAAIRLLDLALHSLAAHQYEFDDAAHQNNTGQGEWELYRSALTLTEAARRAAAWKAPGDIVMNQLDVNQDGQPEVLVQSGPYLYVCTLLGGRLLYWFDLEHGTLLTGLLDFTDYGDRATQEGRHVPDLVGGKNTYTWLAPRMGKPEIFNHTFRIRRASLTDTLSIRGVTAPVGPETPAVVRPAANAPATVSGSAGKLLLSYQIPLLGAGDEHVDVVKTLEPTRTGLNITYTVTDRRVMLAAAAPLDYAMDTEFCLAPDAADVRRSGFEVLGLAGQHMEPPYLDPLGASVAVPGTLMNHVQNLHTGDHLLIDAKGSFKVAGGVFCLLLNSTQELGALRPGQSASFHVGLSDVNLGRDLSYLPTTMPNPPSSLRVPSFVRNVFADHAGDRLRLRWGATSFAPSAATAGDPLHYEFVWTEYQPQTTRPPASHHRVPDAGGVVFVALLFGVLVVRRRR